MRISKYFLMTIVSTLFSASVMAQECGAEGNCCGCCSVQKEVQELGYYPQPYGFIQVQGGMNTIFSPGKQYNPTFSLAGGYMFSQVVGLRLHVNAFEAKNGFRSVDDTYKFKYVNSNIDVMLNLTNFFRKTRNNKVDLYLVGGLGLAYAWDNDDFNAIVKSKKVAEDCNNAWGDGRIHKSLLSHNVRAGLLLDYNISKNLSLGAEIDLNNLSDRFDSKYNDACDWMGTAQLSLTYKFGHKKYVKPAPAPAPVVVAPAPEPEPVVEPEPAPAPEPVAEPVKEEPLHEVLTFAIRESCPINDAIVAKCKAWLEKYPQKSLTLSAYADKGTGNAKLNQMYSEQRMKSAVDCLVAAGIPASRIDAKAFGDTVQPFAENDANRCVIIDGIE